MRSVCLVNGSLRGKEAASLQFLGDLDRRLPEAEFRKTLLTVKASPEQDYPEDLLDSLARADAIVFAFPLHNYGLPGALMRLLEDYRRYLAAGRECGQQARVYAILNCAFPRPGATCGEAVRVMRNFCRRLSLHWRFAVCIGTGPVVAATRGLPFLYPRLKRAYAEIAADIRGSNRSTNDYLVKPVIPESIIAMIKRRYERKGQMFDKRPAPDYRA
jgi:hypothetical protein